MPERRERPAIRGYRIIGEVACYDLPQPASLIRDSLVHSLPQLHLCENSKTRRATIMIFSGSISKLIGLANWAAKAAALNE
jgi:hypothetical protein